MPPTTLATFSMLCSSSPGLYLSGQYAKPKSSPALRPDFSRTGFKVSSVTPG